MSVFQDMVRKLTGKVANIATRVVITEINQDESKGKILVQCLGLDDEIFDDVELIQQSGFHSMPKVGSRGLMIAYNGNKDNATVICVDDKDFGQFALSQGNTIVYNNSGSRTEYDGDNITTTLTGIWKVIIGTTSLTLSEDQFIIDIKGENKLTLNNVSTIFDLITNLDKFTLNATSFKMEINGKNYTFDGTELNTDADITADGTVRGITEVFGGPVGATDISLISHVHTQTNNQPTSPPLP